MTPKAPRYLWQQPGWPNLTFDAAAVLPDLVGAHRELAALEAKAQAIGFTVDDALVIDAFVAEVQATAAIEGQPLQLDAVRSSVMNRLGLQRAGPVDRSADGLVAVVDDAMRRPDAALGHERLHSWQAALFPTGRSGLHRIAVGRYRDHPEPMQIVGGTVVGKETVHYEAPPSDRVHMEMQRFLDWFAATTPGQANAARVDPIARAGLAHLWFEVIHPYEDGNGRIGRAIIDLAMAQGHAAAGDGTGQRRALRLYSLSRQILDSRGDYYAALKAASCGGTDVTAWVGWLGRQIAAAGHNASLVMDAALAKRAFCQRHDVAVNDRQRKVLRRLLDAGDGGFLGGLNVEKYMKLTGAPKTTATRDLGQLVAGGQLWTAGVGKAVRYYVNMPGWSHGVSRDTGADASAASTITPATLGGGLPGALGAATRAEAGKKTSRQTRTSAEDTRPVPPGSRPRKP